jgi:hypothetical protein
MSTACGPAQSTGKQPEVRLGRSPQFSVKQRSFLSSSAKAWCKHMHHRPEPEHEHNHSSSGVGMGTACMGTACMGVTVLSVAFSSVELVLPCAILCQVACGSCFPDTDNTVVLCFLQVRSR